MEQRRADRDASLGEPQARLGDGHLQHCGRVGSANVGSFLQVKTRPYDDTGTGDIAAARGAPDDSAMKVPPFKLDEWLAAHDFATPPIRYNLASSTGPSWTLAELMSL